MDRLGLIYWSFLPAGGCLYMHHVTKVSGLELSSSTTIDVHEAGVGEEEVGRSECLRNLHERLFVYEIETNAAEVRGLDQTTWINNL
jgi:hypothetical protein